MLSTKEPKHTDAGDWTAEARAMLLAEAQAIQAAAERLDGSRFSAAVQLIAGCGGTLVLSGVGKSGHVARKLAATFSSTGTPAFFMHAGEAAHGDVGACRAGDVALLISKSGATRELIEIAPVLRGRGLALIALTGGRQSTLATLADVAIDASVASEADPHNLAPSSSAAVALALGDALAFTVMRARQFTAEQFATNHPGGWLGQLFRLGVADRMARGERLPRVQAGAKLTDALHEMTRCGLGCVCVLAESGELQGLVTDGDVRRAVERGLAGGASVTDVMTERPVTVASVASLYEALRLMEDRPSQIAVLPVVDGARCVGVIRLHDILQLGLMP